MIKFGDTTPEVKDKTEDGVMINSMTAGMSSFDIKAIWLTSPKQLGKLCLDHDTHYWSNGAFNLVHLLLYVLSQIGPAHLIMSSYSFAIDSVTAMKKKLDDGVLLSARFLIDNRVRSLSPKPFAQLVESFPGNVRCTSVHAKVVCLWNDKYKVSIVGSQNATNNPKLERGTIFVNPEVFDFDKTNLDVAFDQGTT